MRGHRPLWRDPVVAATVVAMVLVLGWYAAGFGSARTQLVVCWLLIPPMDLALLITSLRTSRVPGLTRPARRFWRAMAVAGGTFASADIYQTVITLRDHAQTHLVPAPVQDASSVLGAAIVLVVGARYPTRKLGRSARIRLWLDGAILNSAAVVVAWCLLTRPALERIAPDAFLTAVFGSAVLLSGIFITVRMALSGSTPVNAPAAVPLLVAACTQGVFDLLVPDGGDLRLRIIVLLLPTAVVILCPRLQLLIERRGQAVRSPRVATRRYSLLPYAATVLTAAALTLVLATEGVDLSAWGALAGLLVNVALVIVRQVNALAANATLLDRLDASLAEARELHDRLRYQAGHDELTGLANRREFTDRILAGGTGDMAVLLIDLDGFKQINDSYGHASGDAVLAWVADRLRDCSGPRDLPARLGGDEFALLLANADPVLAEQVAVRFRAAIAVPAPIHGRLLAVGASVGVAAGPIADAEQLLHDADLRMYAEKQRARTLGV